MSRRQFCTTAAAGVLTACAKLPRRSNRPTMFIIHGYGATINNHWFGWLQTQLEQRGIAAVRVPMPDSEQPDFDRWQQTLAQYIGKPSENQIFVALLNRHPAAQNWRAGAGVCLWQAHSHAARNQRL